MKGSIILLEQITFQNVFLIIKKIIGDVKNLDLSVIKN